MTGKSLTLAVLAILFAATAVWAMGGGGGGGGGGFGVGTPVDLLMPNPPRDVAATGGDHMATISFTPPKSDGGSPITYYTVKSYPGGIEAKGDRSPIIVKGLTNGKSYSFTVTASNSVGTGLDSGPSNCVTPGE